MTLDAEFWVAMCFIALLLIAYKPIKEKLFISLDARAIKIKKQLEELDAMKQEAANTLKEYKKRQVRAEREVKEIFATAEIEIKTMKENAEKELALYLKRRTIQVMAKISSYETEVIQQLRKDTINTTVSILEEIIKGNNSENTSKELITSSLSELSKRIH